MPQFPLVRRPPPFSSHQRDSAACRSSLKGTSLSHLAIYLRGRPPLHILLPCATLVEFPEHTRIPGWSSYRSQTNRGRHRAISAQYRYRMPAVKQSLSTSLPLHGYHACRHYVRIHALALNCRGTSESVSALLCNRGVMSAEYL